MTDQTEHDAIRDQTLMALGKVAAASSRLEVIAAAVYATLLDSPVAEVVAYGQSWSTVCQACQAILKERPPPMAHLFEDALKQADSLYQERTRAIHGHWIAGIAPVMSVWGKDVGTGESIAILLKRHGRRVVDTWTVKRLDDLAFALEDIGDQLSQLRAFALDGYDVPPGLELDDHG